MKIAVLAQAQGNVNAAKEGLELVRDCQKIIHLGDAIGLGPDPKETLELFLEKEVICLRGLWEERLLKEGGSEQVEWIQNELGPEWIKEVKNFTYRHQEEAISDSIFFYWPKNWKSFLKPPASPANKELERIFSQEKEARIFFGRSRQTIDKNIGEKHLLSPGSLGLNEISLVQGLVINLLPGQVQIEERSAFYDPREVLERMKKKGVPGFQRSS